MSGRSGKAVSDWRRRTKLKLVEAHGGKCVDCNETYPPYVFDFDHRDPSEKLYAIGGNGVTRAYDKLLEESQKCDLVCSNCHRQRTHKQRCSGCPLCN